MWRPDKAGSRRDGQEFVTRRGSGPCGLWTMVDHCRMEGELGSWTIVSRRVEGKGACTTVCDQVVYPDPIVPPLNLLCPLPVRFQRWKNGVVRPLRRGRSEKRENTTSTPPPIFKHTPALIPLSSFSPSQSQSQRTHSTSLTLNPTLV